jgi:hypothetical protein
MLSPHGEDAIYEDACEICGNPRYTFERGSEVCTAEFCLTCYRRLMDEKKRVMMCGRSDFVVVRGRWFWEMPKRHDLLMKGIQQR